MNTPTNPSWSIEPLNYGLKFLAQVSVDRLVGGAFLLETPLPWHATINIVQGSAAEYLQQNTAVFFISCTAWLGMYKPSNEHAETTELSVIV